MESNPKEKKGLFGFKKKEEKNLFLRLINVKGLGPKMALPMVSTGNTADVIEAIEKEKAVQMEAAKNDEKLKDKPEQALVKIIEGKVNKIFAESVLVKQDYLLDPSQKVEQVLTSNKISVAKFVRYQVGEGIAKREENFAEEVAKQMN